MKTSKPISMTIRVNKGRDSNAKVPFYYVGGQTFVRLDDVISVLRTNRKKFYKGTEIGYLCKDQEKRLMAFFAISKVVSQILRTETSQARDMDEYKKILEHYEHHLKPSPVPGRYAVGKNINGDWVFVRLGDSGSFTTPVPCLAHRYETYKQAEACADFMDTEGWQVLDFWEFMSNEEQDLRELLRDNDADDGNENAIKL